MPIYFFYNAFLYTHFFSANTTPREYIFFSISMLNMYVFSDFVEYLR